MSLTWRSHDEPRPVAPGAAGWARALARGVPLVVVTLAGLVVLLLLRPLEALIFGPARPVTARVAQAIGRIDLRLLGIRLRVCGTPLAGPGAVVANHTSWLDIVALNAACRVTFVSKAEVANWPGIGWMARAVGTLFITRDPREAAAQSVALEASLRAGRRLLFFPEGTSTDGRRVLPFKTTLFAPFLTEQLRHLAVQPVSVAWQAPEGEDARFYGWWGDMDLGPHMLQVLAARRQGEVVVTLHPPLLVCGFSNRKALAAQAEHCVRTGHAAALGLAKPAAPSAP